ncbi:MAG TPA: hypothetical protein VEL47_02155 [Myxococcota bacterium]|nr:hypothetical protein [Myxococcota bacterium]
MLVLASSMQAYFREALNVAMRKSNVVFTDNAQVYVVHLLNEFSRSEKAFAGVNYGEKLIMAQFLERAYSSEEREALQIYRHLGDTSLYLLGFFKESSANRIVSDTYYKDMGSAAYACASGLSRAYAGKNAALFQELSERFSDMVMVMETIAHYRDHQENS